MSSPSRGTPPRVPYSNVGPRIQRPRSKFTTVSTPVEFAVKDDYAEASNSVLRVRKRTGIIYDRYMFNHVCEWDPNYPENPDRLAAILHRLEEINVDQHLFHLTVGHKTEHYFLKKHAYPLIRKLQDLAQVDNIQQLEREASQYDSVYFNKFTCGSASLAASCVSTLVTEVCKQNLITNGVALVRPPGHHAMENEFCGYCFFNNVALAAQDALDERLAHKILIVDFDVHHGQATQQMFYHDNRVLYFSIHRYEHGTFWPNLRESNFDFIGNGLGKGFNINFPLNVTGLEDKDYLAIVFNILLPVAYEYNPDLIIVSAGYDSAVGDVKGKMNLTPAFYGHLIKLLSGLARGKLAVVLEGGYFIPSLAEGVARTITALIDYPTDRMQPIGPPHETVVEVINSLRTVLRPYWRCFNIDMPLQGEAHHVEILYRGVPDRAPFPTRDCYPRHTIDEIVSFTDILLNYRTDHPIIAKRGVCYGYDKSMLMHTSLNHPETPYRLEVLMEKFEKEFHFNERCTKVDSIPITKEMLMKVHSETYVNNLFEGEFMYDKDRTDIYVNENTKDAALTSVSVLYGVVEQVLEGHFDSGVALIRPPGHHAEQEEAGGFCFINNVAVMAAYIADKYDCRVMILDWDIHHGNGTQRMFYDRDDIMYLSVHKFEEGKFFPNKMDADFSYVGGENAKGYNVNIPLNENRMRNEDYMAIFHQIILPVAYSFGPHIILVSAGFDAGIHDRLGNYVLAPEVFGHFVQLLRSLAQGKIILALEGGYNPSTVAYSMLLSIKGLLGDPLPPLGPSGVVYPSVGKTMANVMQVQKPFWPILDTLKPLAAVSAGARAGAGSPAGAGVPAGAGAQAEAGGQAGAGAPVESGGPAGVGAPVEVEGQAAAGGQAGAGAPVESGGPAGVEAPAEAGGQAEAGAPAGVEVPAEARGKARAGASAEAGGKAGAAAPAKSGGPAGVEASSEAGAP